MALPSLLLISHAYAASENRKKAAALCEFCEVHLVTGTGEKEVVLGRDATEFETASSSPVPYRLTKLRKKGKVQSATRFYFENLAPVFQERAYDAVVVEVEPWSPLRWQCWRLARRYQKKARFIEFTWENVLRSGWKKELLGMVYRLAAQTHDGVVCGNQAAARIFQGYGAKPEHILVAPQIGVDEACYHSLGKEEKDRAKVQQFGNKDGLWIGYCGRLVWEKGIMELVRAVEAARNGPVGRPLQLALLGAGDLWPQLEGLAADRPWLRLLPPRTHAEVASFLQALDWFVLPSQPRHDREVVWEEQFGHVLIEAMACGVPCLGSNSGAIPEVLGDPAAIFPAFAVEPLTRLLMQARQNPGMALQFAQNQAARLTSHYTHAAVAQRWAPFLFGQPAPFSPPQSSIPFSKSKFL